MWEIKVEMSSRQLDLNLGRLIWRYSTLLLWVTDKAMKESMTSTQEKKIE